MKLQTDLLEARDNIIAAQEHQRFSAHSSRREQTFEIGEYVLVA
jgi:hypothetical protein